jgi:hypothetical protein
VIVSIETELAVVIYIKNMTSPPPPGILSVEVYITLSMFVV